jgi:hypothetical protein
MPINYQHGVEPTLQLAQNVGLERQRLIEQERRDRIESQKLDQQFQLEKENRARAWEIEKMEMSSRHDFDMQEQERQVLFQRDLSQRMKEQDELDYKVKAIRESNILSAEDKELAMIQVLSGVPTYNKATPQETNKTESPIAQALRRISEGTTTSTPSGSKSSVSTPVTRTPLVAGTGGSLFETASGVKQAIAAGKRIKTTEEKVNKNIKVIEQRAPEELVKAAEEINMAAGLWRIKTTQEMWDETQKKPWYKRTGIITEPITGKGNPKEITPIDLRKLDRFTEEDKLEFNAILASGNPARIRAAILALKEAK